MEQVKFVGDLCYLSNLVTLLDLTASSMGSASIIKLGARLGGATKELLPNLDTYKNNEKSTIPLRFLFFGGCFGKQICSFLCVLRPPSGQLFS